MKNVNQDGKFAPDDPRLTAYALGELEGEDRAEVETQLVHDAEARATVEAVRTMAHAMTHALAGEGATVSASSSRSSERPSSALGRAAIVGGPDLSKFDGGKYRHPGNLVRFPQFYYLVSGLAAACFIAFVATRSPTPRSGARTEGKHYTVIDLGPPTPAPAVTVQLPVTPPDDAIRGEIPATAIEVPFGPKLASETQAPAPNLPAESQVKPTLLEQVKSEVAEAGASAPVTAPKSSSIADAGLTPDSNAGRDTVPARSGQQPAPAQTPATESKSVAQSAPLPLGGAKNSPTIATGGLHEGLVMLSPFTVSTSRDAGYGASSTLASGTRLRPATAPLPALHTPPRGARFGDTEAYAYTPDNDFVRVQDHPLSTFSIDADTASYTNIRRFLSLNQRPPRDAVRIEEMLNYFPYRYPAPIREDTPFAAALEVASAPWAPEHRLVRIGLKGREVSTAARPLANLVFLLDVSGSMNAPNRLPLVKESLRMLIDKLRPEDRVAIVTYAGKSGLALASTPAAQKREILAALDELTPGGSTNGAMGIQLAYDIARANFVSDGINRVILCTDGDFNVGVRSEGDLVRLIENKAQTGVFLTVLGFGIGNLKDSMLEKLADKGNGTYGYIDSRREAEKIFVEQVNGTLVTIAKDVKVQIEFNPAKVARYRLIGYENRLLKKEDFNNDQIDAGELGAGRTVTALYELVLVGATSASDPAVPPVDGLKYQTVESAPASRVSRLFSRPAKANEELLTVKLRYKKPDGILSRRLEFPMADTGASFASASTDFKFAAAVASFGMLLRDSPHKGTATFAHVLEWAEAGTSDDPGGWRAEFQELARKGGDALKVGRVIPNAPVRFYPRFNDYGA